MTPEEGEAVRKAISKHRVAASSPEDTACSCDRTWRKNQAWRVHLADAVIAAIEEASR